MKAPESSPSQFIAVLAEFVRVSTPMATNGFVSSVTLVILTRKYTHVSSANTRNSWTSPLGWSAFSGRISPRLSVQMNSCRELAELSSTGEGEPTQSVGLPSIAMFCPPAAVEALAASYETE